MRWRRAEAARTGNAARVTITGRVEASGAGEASRTFTRTVGSRRALVTFRSVGGNDVISWRACIAKASARVVAFTTGTRLRQPRRHRGKYPRRTPYPHGKEYYKPGCSWHRRRPGALGSCPLRDPPSGSPRRPARSARSHSQTDRHPQRANRCRTSGKQ